MNLSNLIPHYIGEDRRSKARIRIDFINFEEFWDESRSYPVGILSISSYLKKNGFANIGIVDHVCTLRKEGEHSDSPHNFRQIRLDWLVSARTRSVEEMFKYLKKRKPHIILIGPVTTFYLIELTSILPKLREQFPTQIILAGGPHFGKDRNLDRELLEGFKELDGIVIGEAEETVTEAVKKFWSSYASSHRVPNRAKFREKLSDIHGIAVDGRKFKARKPPNLSDVPFPDMKLIEEHLGEARKYSNDPKYQLSKRRNPVVWVSYGVVDDAYGGGNTEDDIHYFEYTFASRDQRFPFGVIVGSRGCPFKCAFCCTPAMRRVFSAERIFLEIDYLARRYGIRLFVFFDALFVDSSPADQKRIKELCRILSMSDIDIRFMIELRADVICKLSDNLLRLMMKSGCIEFNLGLEKGSDRMLQEMSKKNSIEDHKKAVAKIRRIADELMVKVIVNGTFILGGPGEKKQDIRDTLLHCFGLHLDQVTLYPMEIHPGTEVGARALAEGIIKPGLAAYLDAKAYPLYETKSLSREYLFGIKRKTEQTLDALDELKKTMQGVERQFLPEGVRDGIVNFEIREARNLQARIEECIDVFVDFIKKSSEEELAVKGPLQKHVGLAIKRVEKAITEIEERLVDKYPDYDYHCGDYYPGTLMNNWSSFRRSFETLFSTSNFRD